MNAVLVPVSGFWTPMPPIFVDHGDGPILLDSGDES